MVWEKEKPAPQSENVALTRTPKPKSGFETGLICRHRRRFYAIVNSIPLHGQTTEGSSNMGPDSHRRRKVKGINHIRDCPNAGDKTVGRNMDGRSCAGEEHITGNWKRFCHTESMTLTALFLCSIVFWILAFRVIKGWIFAWRCF